MQKWNVQKFNRPVIFAAVVCLISVVVMVLAVCNPRQIVGDFVPPEFDPAAQTGTPVVPDDLGWMELDANLFRASVCGKVMLNGSNADIWLTNPSNNQVWLKLRVMDGNGKVLGETGLIRPGEYVQTVFLSDIPEAGSDIVLKIMAYAPETYYSEGSATVNAVVDS